MATTGFWPVKGKLKDILNYAGNPDKTTDRKHSSDGLPDVLDYVADSSKTDKIMYVSGINCPKKRAYEAMMTTKKRFGKLGGNVAYHGYQSFNTGEVTPEEAHRIGVEAAKRMWGDEYEILVTTHLNTENIHNHFVVNSVSFKTGLKFQNHISDHKRFREISDSLCREYGKKVIEDAPFYDSQKKEYWIHKSGKTTHRNALKNDVDLAIANSRGRSEFIYYMQSLGYIFERDFHYEYPSVRHTTWKKTVRLNSLGAGYSTEAILKRLDINYQDNMFKPFYSPPRNRRPILLYYPKYDEYKRKDMVTIIIELFIQIIKICTGDNIEEDKRLYSPSFRAEWRNIDRITEDHRFLMNHHIQTMPELTEYTAAVEKQIESYMDERQKLRNRIRRADPENTAVLKEQCKEITQKLKTLRDDVKRCDRIKERSERIDSLMIQEYELETGAKEKEARNR